MRRLSSLSVFPLDIALSEPFGIATGAQLAAENVFVRLQLDDGSVGYGEAAPVAHISGETQQNVLDVLRDAHEVLAERDLSDYRRVCGELSELVGETRSALSALEIALFDALCKSAGFSLRSLLGGQRDELAIDVTVTTGSVTQARDSAEKYARAGFSTLKVKVGADDIDGDVRRLEAIGEAAPEASLIIDGNTAYTPKFALSLLEGVGDVRSRILAFEQPVAREDIDGLCEVQSKGRIAVIADESLRSRVDFETIARCGGIAGVNLKTAKLGLLAAWDLLVAAHSLGMRVMVGGMVETEISMSASACLAAGVGGVDFVDLDTPLFLGKRPTTSAIRPWGPRLDLRGVSLGHGAGFSSGFSFPPA